MQITCSDITNFIENLAPKQMAEEWDNVGLIIGSLRKEVKRIMLCLDATSAVISEAVSRNIDMLISHHPLMFKSIKNIDFDEWPGRNIGILIKNDISVYCAHTNLDSAETGINHFLAGLFGLNRITSLKPGSGNEDFHTGACGFMKEKIGLSDFINIVKKSLNIPFVRVIGGIDGNIKKAAVFCGSYNGDLSAMIDENIDIMVTGDLKYHTALDIIENGLCVIDAGHYNTEKIYLQYLAELIQNEFERPEFEGLSVICNTVEADPFIVR